MFINSCTALFYKTIYIEKAEHQKMKEKNILCITYTVTAVLLSILPMNVLRPFLL
ncbi:MAG: hypothetical protein ACOC6H_01050 [Thermoproteota archaeon]